ncbi:S-layer homology domain-containing protein [Gorillibacterium massiliense]|uniref:S-layer homology domain-containing protein n=1 Tax=Gorillibacterium massiliense TaxID=1280390 RepID=UPI0004B32770|nr:S-layer homology domain-containing protein [Gorillibacterium massiliense]
MGVDQTKNGLDTIMLPFFSLSNDGSLIVSPLLDQSFINDMKSRNVRTVAYLNNEWSRALAQAALTNRESLARQIADAISTNHLDGINVDLENMPPSDKDRLTDFVRLLRQSLSPEKEVSIAVGAIPDADAASYMGAYDYAALAKWADHLTIMAYDESYEGSSDAGPVASVSFVERSLQYALARVPANQIVLALPLYGRMWSADLSVKGMGLTEKTIQSLIQKFHGTITTVQGKAAKAVITVPAGANPVVNGKTLSPGTYTIWYDNEASRKEKLLLVSKYGLRGGSYWSLGQESANLWDYSVLWLNGAYFTDAEGHWAANWIASAAQSGWLSGTAPSRFEPDRSLTRAEAAAVLMKAYSGNGLSLTKGEMPFTDIPANYWGEQAISWAWKSGVVTGATATTFAPQMKVTREEWSLMLYRAANHLATGESTLPFSDMLPKRWSYTAVSSLYQQGIISGYTDGTFRPNASITRAEMSVMLVKAKEKQQ